MKKFTQISELSTELLARYKKKASTQSSENDKTAFSGKVSNARAQELLNKSNKRYRGIIKATGKQFANDTKKRTNEEVEQIDELSKETLISYKKQRIAQRMTRDLRWKDSNHPDVKKARNAEAGIDKATKKLAPMHKKAEEERNKKLAAADKANRPAHEAEMKKIKADYEKHHGPIEKGGHQNAGRAYGAGAGSYRQGKEMYDRYHNLKKRISEEVIVTESAKPNELHISEVGGGKYKVHAVGSKFAHGIKVGEHLNDTHLDDFSDMGGKIKYVKPEKKD